MIRVTSFFIMFPVRSLDVSKTDPAVHHGTRAITFQPKAPASRTAQAKHPLFLRLMSAFQPFCAQSARTKISRSDPRLRRRDSRFICGGKLPILSSTGDEPGVERSSIGDGGTSRTLVMQSMTSTRLVFALLDGFGFAVVVFGSRRKSAKK